MVEKKIIDEAMELTKDIPATDLVDKVLTPILSDDQSESSSYKIKLEWDILREPSTDKMIRKLVQVSDQWWETVGGIVPVNTISGVIFYQLIKRTVAVDDDAENILDNGVTWDNSFNLDGLWNEDA